MTFNSPEFLLGIILLGVVLVSAFTAVVIFLTVCWYKRQSSLKNILPMTKKKAEENDYVEAPVSTPP